MKKLVLVALVILPSILLASCGGSSESEPATDTVNTEATQPATTDPATDEATDPASDYGQGGDYGEYGSDYPTLGQQQAQLAIAAQFAAAEIQKGASMESALEKGKTVLRPEYQATAVLNNNIITYATRDFSVEIDPDGQITPKPL